MGLSSVSTPHHFSHNHVVIGQHESPEFRELSAREFRHQSSQGGVQCGYAFREAEAATKAPENLVRFGPVDFHGDWSIPPI
jgi:hypothetical protein